MSEIPFFCYTKGWKPFGHERSRERISYLADRRNKAVLEALLLFPETEHILMVDSYYIKQSDEIFKLVKEYDKLSSELRDCILGASTWRPTKTGMRSTNSFYDTWTTPEGVGLRWEDARERGGLLRVRSVGGCYLYPRFVWEKYGYGVPEDLHGCEHNWLCERSGLPVFLSFNERLWREPLVYPPLKRIRFSLHLGRFLSSKIRTHVV